MNPVSYIESRLGPIALWPSYILWFLFVDVTNPATVRCVAVFLYGNRIECGMAAHFYYICNGQAGVSVRQFTYACYVIWHNSRKIYHIVEYFDMRLRQYLYVNVSMRLRGVEPVVSVPSPINFRPDGIGFPMAIHIILATIRSQGSSIHFTFRDLFAAFCQ
jgi:hypothetical protein